jgi:hypothetical protein
MPSYKKPFDEDTMTSEERNQIQLQEEETGDLISSKRSRERRWSGATARSSAPSTISWSASATARLRYAVMSYGGFFGMGEHYYPLPWDALTYDEDCGGYVVDIDKDRLRDDKAPSFHRDEEPEWDANSTGKSESIISGPCEGWAAPARRSCWLPAERPSSLRRSDKPAEARTVRKAGRWTARWRCEAGAGWGDGRSASTPDLHARRRAAGQCSGIPAHRKRGADDIRPGRNGGDFRCRPFRRPGARGSNRCRPGSREPGGADFGARSGKLWSTEQRPAPRAAPELGKRLRCSLRFAGAGASASYARWRAEWRGRERQRLPHAGRAPDSGDAVARGWDGTLLGGQRAGALRHLFHASRIRTAHASGRNFQALRKTAPGAERSEGRQFVMRTRPEQGCSDGMSDIRYPIAVSLTVMGEERRGCAQALTLDFRKAAARASQRAAGITARLRASR